MALVLSWAPWILAYAVLAVVLVTLCAFFAGWWRLAKSHRLDPKKAFRGIKIDSVPVSLGWGSWPGLPPFSCKVIVTDEGFILGKRFLWRALCPEIFARWKDIEEVFLLSELPEHGIAVKLRDQWPVLYLDGVAAAKIWRCC
jgi:hypothetical protein